MAISVYTAGQKTGSFLRNLHGNVMRKVKYGIGYEGTQTITRWQFPGREAHAGQVLRINNDGRKSVRTIETAFRSSQGNSRLQPYMRETISEDKFTKSQVADVMFSSADGVIERVVGNPQDPAIINFVKRYISNHHDGKSLILGRY